MPKRKYPLAVDPNPHDNMHDDGPSDERAYRRGFEHGMMMALSLPWIEITRRKRHSKWVRAVWRWRERTKVYREPPPEPRILDSERPREFWNRWYKATPIYEDDETLH